MKNLQICLLVLLAALFAGCETEGKFRDTSYYNPQVTFNPTWLQGDYRITYNGSESPYVSKSEKTFKLEIFRKDDATDTPVLAEMNVRRTKRLLFFVRLVLSWQYIPETKINTRHLLLPLFFQEIKTIIRRHSTTAK